MLQIKVCRCVNTFSSGAEIDRSCFCTGTMDFVDLSLTMCSSIYKMAENMKANKDRCKRVAQRVKALQELVLTIKERGSTQISSAVENALKELCATLTSAEETMRKFSQTKGVKSFLKSGNHEDKFSKINERLTDNFQVLTGALQIEQGNLLQKMYENVSVRKQHEGYGEGGPICSTVHMTPLPPKPESDPSAPTPGSSPTAPTSPMSNLPPWSESSLKEHVQPLTTMPPMPESSPRSTYPPMPESSPTAPMPETSPTLAMSPMPMLSAAASYPPMPESSPRSPYTPMSESTPMPPMPECRPMPPMPESSHMPPMPESSPTAPYPPMPESSPMPPMPESSPTAPMLETSPTPAMSPMPMSSATAPYPPMPESTPMPPMPESGPRSPITSMPMWSPTAPCPPMPESSPRSSMWSPTAPYPAMPVCCPPAPMLPMPVPSATAAMSVPSTMPHVQIYSPTSVMPVCWDMSPHPASVPAAQLVMDFIEHILSIASEIYSLVETVKANKKRCRRVSCRVKALEELLRSIQQKETGKPSREVEKALTELSITLKSAEDLIKKYTQANWVERVLKSGSHGDEFNSVNERLNDAFQVLSGALQVQQGELLYRVFAQTSRDKEDEEDRREDDEELKKLLRQHMTTQEEKMEAMRREFESLKTQVEEAVKFLSKPSITDETIRMIRPDEIQYEHPKEPFMTTATSEVYRGQYRGFQVAIKRYIDPVDTCAREVRSVFTKEVKTMKRFESPNILRMFGISVQDEEGPCPQFLIIMEYCEKGNLRQVLDSDCRLSWTRKAGMCLDAAKGLYRLHQSEEKSKVHGSINSHKFLVAKGFTVKLGGFELAKTETSLRRSPGSREVRTLCYSPPQLLGDINHVYGKDCEMYSFGIIMWEIATRERPFKGLSSEEIYQKVYEEKFQEPLPADCPRALADLIDACRAYDGFRRPSAGVLVDKLRIVVMELEKEEN
ncbi:uncharacterized protein V6R79_023878 [Siganus canaliculatus]